MMKSGIQFSIAATLAITISGCGGSSDDNPVPEEKTPQSPPTPSSSEEDLKSRYREHVDDRYLGIKSKADLSQHPESIQQFNAMLVGPERIFWPAIPTNFYRNIIDRSVTAPKSFDESFECLRGGSFHVKGTLDADRQGTFELDYSDCNYSYGTVLNGPATIALTSADNSSAVLFFDGLSVQRYTGLEKRLTGYVDYSGYDETAETDSELYLLSTDAETGNQRVSKSVRRDRVAPSSITFEGTLLLSDYGRVDLSTDQAVSSNDTPQAGQLRFVGGNSETAFIDYVDSDFTRLLLDQTGDTVPDVGYYFSSPNHLFSADFATIKLMPVDTLGFPPEVDSLRLISQSPDTTDTIRIEPATYRDRDTEDNKLSAAYEWNVNGDLHPEANGTSLPSSATEKGDEIKVRALVSDGQFTGYSSWLTFIIADAPGTASIGELPDQIRTGETLVLEATYTDPDIPDVQPANLVYGPPAMNINTEGAIEWTVDQTLFDTSTVNFGFNFPGDPTGEIKEFTLKVEAPGVGLPRSRSGITFPDTGYKAFVADFMHNADNEIITTDSHRVYAIQEVEGRYREAWVYPYEMPTGGLIKSIGVFDTDNDGKQEILVASGGGLNLIQGPEDRAVPVWETEDNVDLMTVSDMDQDGRAEVVVISTQTSGYNGYQTLTVLELGETVQTVFETAMNNQASGAAIGNVDSDPNLELVMNNGLVYDGKVWTNDWYRGTPFSNGPLALGDLDGDGIDEIAAAHSRSSELRIFSATEKSLIYSSEIAYTCSLQLTNIDQDAADELVTGSCSSGNIVASNWDGGALQPLWELPSGGYSPSVVTVGDIDNDGGMEIFWGVDEVASDRNTLMVADLTDSVPETVYGKGDNLPLGSSFMAAGWGKTGPDEEYAVFSLPQAGQGNREHRLVYMANDAQFVASSALTTGYNNRSHAQVSDFNLDGSPDVFVSTRNGFKALALNDLSEHWSIDVSSGDMGKIAALKLNGDAYPDAAYIKGASISAIDVYNQTLLHTITTSEDIQEFVYIPTSSGELYLAIALDYSDGIEIWRKQGNTFERHSQYDVDCLHLASVRVDDDPEPELVCARRYISSGESELVVFNLAEGSLQESHRFRIEGRITDLIVDESRSTSQMLIAATTSATSYYYEPKPSYIRGISPQAGKEIWSSPALIGKVQAESLQYRPNVGNNQDRLMFTTEQAMYLVK